MVRRVTLIVAAVYVVAIGLCKCLMSRSHRPISMACCSNFASMCELTLFEVVSSRPRVSSSSRM